jgi:hypothetical protein
MSIAYLQAQQTPNPEAHVPYAVPPPVEHSALLKQVPLYNGLVDTHPLLGNRIIEKTERTGKDKF